MQSQNEFGCKMGDQTSNSAFGSPTYTASIDPSYLASFGEQILLVEITLQLLMNHLLLKQLQILTLHLTLIIYILNMQVLIIPVLNTTPHINTPVLARFTTMREITDM